MPPDVDDLGRLHEVGEPSTGMRMSDQGIVDALLYQMRLEPA